MMKYYPAAARRKNDINLGSDEGLEGSDASTKRLDERTIVIESTKNSNSSIQNQKKSAPGEGFDGNDNINNDTKLWNEYKDYLIKQKQSRHTVRNKLQYAKRFHDVLLNNNAQILFGVSEETRQHAMKSLSSLSKYLGMYDKWQDLIKRYQLKWTQKGGYDAFQKIFSNDEGQGYSLMFRWVKDSVGKLPKEYANLILFSTLTGLRPDESYQALNLIKTREKEYVDKEKWMLMHYKFPDTFLRVSKKAYVSVIDQDILEIAYHTPSNLTYDSIRRKMKEHGIKMHMYYCRKIFATHLRNNGIAAEIIDLIQGRTPSSIFVNHYYRPDMNDIMTNKIRPVLVSLLKELA